MTEKMKNIIETLAARDGVTPEYVEHEMKEAIRAAMQTDDPQAQLLWKQIAPDGKEPDLDTFLSFIVEQLAMMEDLQNGDFQS